MGPSTQFSELYLSSLASESLGRTKNLTWVLVRWQIGTLWSQHKARLIPRTAFEHAQIPKIHSKIRIKQCWNTRLRRIASIIWGFVQDEVSFLFKNRFSGDACARQKQPFESKVEILLTNKLPDKLKKKQKKKHHPGQVSSLSSPSCVWSNYTHDCLSPVSWRGKGAAGHSDPQHLYCLTFRSDDVKGFIRFVPDDKWRRHPRSVHMSLERCMQLSAH